MSEQAVPTADIAPPPFVGRGRAKDATSHPLRVSPFGRHDVQLGVYRTSSA